MGSFSASPFLSLRLFWKAKVKLKTMTEQMQHAHIDFTMGIVIIFENTHILLSRQELDEKIDATHISV